MADPLYGDLLAIERRQKNQISTGSDARSRFAQAIAGCRPSSIRINGALKVFRMAIRFEGDAPRPRAANIRACRLWMSALYAAAEGSMVRALFASLPLDDPLALEFVNGDEGTLPLEREGLGIRGILAVAWTVLCTIGFGALVLYLRWDFLFCAIICFFVLNAGLWLILCVSRLRTWLRWLERSRNATDGELQAFLKKIRLRKISYSPCALWHLARQQLQALHR